jgi:uncharacterized RDD family membrane protein YckC
LTHPARLILVLLILLLLASARAALARQLLADGSDDGMWVASTLVGPAPAEPQTFVLGRKTGSTQWDGIYQIAAYPLALTHQRTQPVLLIENGQWMFLFRGGRSLGAPAPAGGKILTLSTTGDHLLSVVSVPGGLAAIPTTDPAAPAADTSTRPASTVPAATAPSVTTAPASRPALPPRLVLMELRDGRWDPLAELPDVDPSAQVSLVGSPSRIILAVRATDEQLHMLEWTDAQGFRPLPPITFTAKIGDFKVLAAADQPIVWVAAGTGAGSLYLFKAQAWTAPVELTVAADFSQPLPRDVATTSKDRVRLVYRKGEKVYQQLYELPDARPVGDPEPVVVVLQDGNETPQGRWFSVGIMAALAFVLLSAMRRQELIQETLERRAELNLAPIFRRFAAGLIDLSPYLVTTLVVFAPRLQAGRTQQEILQEPAVIRAVVIALAVYFAHVTVGELLFARSIGKWLFGLKVTDLQGNRPRATAILLRNVFRIIDLSVLYVPLMVSPLRQRVGDLAGGTLVVRSDTPAAKDASTS